MIEKYILYALIHHKYQALIQLKQQQINFVHDAPEYKTKKYDLIMLNKDLANLHLRATKELQLIMKAKGKKND